MAAKRGAAITMMSMFLITTMTGVAPTAAADHQECEVTNIPNEEHPVAYIVECSDAQSLVEECNDQAGFQEGGEEEGGDCDIIGGEDCEDNQSSMQPECVLGDVASAGEPTPVFVADYDKQCVDVGVSEWPLVSELCAHGYGNMRHMADEECEGMSDGYYCLGLFGNMGGSFFSPTSVLLSADATGTLGALSGYCEMAPSCSTDFVEDDDTPTVHEHGHEPCIKMSHIGAVTSRAYFQGGPFGEPAVADDIDVRLTWTGCGL